MVEQETEPLLDKDMASIQFPTMDQCTRDKLVADSRHTVSMYIASTI